MLLKDIIIPEEFRECPPSEWKMMGCRQYFSTYREIDRDIVVSQHKRLLDGYVGYLVLLENGVIDTPVKVVQHDADTYVTARLLDSPKSYTWKVSYSTKDIDKLAVGRQIIARTKYGLRMAVVEKIEELVQPPVPGRIKSVFRCL